ncbi:inositol 2-dehydrogenase [Lactococcus ileimucosae]|uniref:inositol 2-dehydrogenase n=1 Tax=Lactococcus ileimucosae TaxID=2941329 RepID=UPI0020445749|nr:inositol 2-dehydrogenase [Lactococcus ileimucosae]
MKKVNIAIISYGRIGRVHMKNLIASPYYNVVMVCDILKPDDFEREYPEIPFVFDYTEVLANPDVDAVLIGTPTSFHPAQIRAAAEAGKHVFCEKPLGSSMKEILEAYEAVKRAGIILQTGFNRRFDDDFLAIKSRISEIGEPQILKITSRDPGMPPLEYIEKSGGLFMDMTIHDFDMARYMFGEVKSVFVQATALVDSTLTTYGDVDTAVITLTFENGAIGVIDNSRQAVYGYDQRLEVFGSKGMLQNSNHLERNTVFSSKTGVVSEKPQHFFLERYLKSYETELAYFAKSILDKTPVVCTMEDGIMAIKIAQAAQKSYQIGSTVALNTP